jgi:hypothetical protein
VAAREPGDVTEPGTPLATLSAKLSVYTGLVETARANNHQGLPVGAAYQREASNLMRTELLPAAQELYRSETARVAADQDDAGAVPWFEVLVALVGLGVLVVAQVYLRRHSNRVFNVGLVVATGAALASLVWVLVATLGARADVEEGRDVFGGMDGVAKARIDTLTARADETLTLVARGSGEAFEEDFQDAFGRLSRFLDGSGTNWSGYDSATTDHLETAGRAADGWSEVHEEIRDADGGGDYPRAVELAIGPGEDGATARFDEVDSALGDALEITTGRFDDEVSQASSAVTGTVLGVIVLAVLMAAGSVVGIWQRLKEYR